MNDSSTKYEKRYRLTQTRNKNIKKAITILIIFLIMIGIGNHLWNKHMDKVKLDQSRIQNMNQMLIYEVNNSLDELNDVIIKLIYDMETDEYDYVKVIEASNVMSDLSWIRYDYDLYRIDTFDTFSFLRNVSDTVRDGLIKEGLTEDEKAGLAELLKFNHQVSTVINEINYKFFDHDKREELEYLYFYKGEMLYLLNNTVASYMVGVDTYFIDIDYSKNYVVRDKLSVEEANLIASHISNEVLNLGDVYVDEKQFATTVDNRQVLHSLHFKNDDFSEEEFIDVDLEGHFYYNNEHKDTTNTISHESLLEETESIIKIIDEPLLQLVTNSEEEFNNGEGDRIRHRFTYSIVDGDYEDPRTRVSFQYTGDGVLTSFSISDTSLLMGKYQRQVGVISRDEAIKLLPERVWPSVLDISEEKRDKQAYIIVYEDYGHEFKTAIDVNTGEILDISENEWLAY